MADYFPSTYEGSRERFQLTLELLQKNWPNARLETHPLNVYPDLSIDWIWAEPQKKETLIIVTTGLHGIEGYLGSAVQRLFLDEFMPCLNPQNTGLLLVHAINPWGMKNHRRCTENNVDLNRNFLWNENFDPTINPDYEPLFPLLNPPRLLKSLLVSDLAFYARLMGAIIKLSITRIRLGMLSGQYRHPRGVQFGGQSTQENTEVVKGLFRESFECYGQVIHMDLHCGYGPRYQMSMVNSMREQAPASELVRRFNYPLIVAANPTDFYSVSGDITEYLYRLRDEKFPSRKLYGTCLEFGTFGASLPAQIRSMRVTVMENRVTQYGASDAARAAVQQEYGELFYPDEPRWRDKALTDARQAFKGILSAYNLIN